MTLTVMVLAVTFVAPIQVGPHTDILQQVEKLLKDMKTRESTGEKDLRLARAELLAELVKQYQQCVKDQEWKYSYYCLVNMFELIGDILVEAAGK